VLLFGIAGWESAKHGYDALVHHQAAALAGTVTVAGATIPAVYVNYAILLGGVLFEGYAFRRAYHSMAHEIRQHGWSGFVEGFRKTANVTTLTALTEDTIALLGLGLALVGIWLSRFTGNPVYDAAAAFLIGIMLMGFAVALAWENKRLLLGESLPAVDERRLREIVEGWEDVVHVDDFRSVYFGPNQVLVTADVSFDPDLDTAEIDDHIGGIERSIKNAYGGVSKVYIEPET
ncbi:MAG TPA: cation transporter dimerization domain-containing protein, partial [Halobacteriales archaeon]|nr:cation transporter dimerization domain-containing protein [Halobacteriales archaeon]